MIDSAAGILGFMALLVTALGIEVAARRLPGRAPAAQALGAAMRTGPGRVVVLGAWLWLGVHVLAR